MACDPFDVTLAGDVSTVFARLKALVESYGGVVNGDQNSGTVSGNISLLGAFHGNYVFSGSTVTITITQKPVLIPCTIIQSKVKEYVGAL